MPITTRNELQQEFAAGRGFLFPVKWATSSAPTAAGNGSNNLTLALDFHGIGSTLPGTLQDIPRPASPPRDWLTQLYTLANTSTSRGVCLVWLYKFGTVNLAATGNQFTHNAATFPILRTRYGAASQPITLIPLLYITTATTSSAPAFILQVNGGGTGYVDQDGNNVDAATTFTCPAAATAVQSCYALRLEAGDCGVRDISQIDVTTAGMAGAADVWGMEFIGGVGNSGPFSLATDVVFAGLGPVHFTPGVATTGTAVVRAAIVGGSTASALSTPGGLIVATMNTA